MNFELLRLELNAMIMVLFIELTETERSRFDWDDKIFSLPLREKTLYILVMSGILVLSESKETVLDLHTLFERHPSFRFFFLISVCAIGAFLGVLWFICAWARRLSERISACASACVATCVSVVEVVVLTASRLECILPIVEALFIIPGDIAIGLSKVLATALPAKVVALAERVGGVIAAHLERIIVGASEMVGLSCDEI